MKKILFACCIALISVLPSQAQYLSAKDSDPEALALLTKASKSFIAGNNAQVQFKLTTKFPGQETQTSDGTFYQSGKSYRLELKDYQIISNGSTRWVYLKGPNEVNIYNESNGQDWISPQDFLTLHSADDLVFSVMTKKPDGVSVIEAKPLKGRFDEYSKFSIGIKNGALNYINALSSDGMRQEMSITSVSNPASLDASKFIFDAKAYPGVYIEDLRLD